MTTILIMKDDKVVETLRIRSEPIKYIIYRGRLLERLNTKPLDTNLYIERSYLEID